MAGIPSRLSLISTAMVLPIVLDRRNGKLLKANKFDPSVNWAKEIDLKTGRPSVDPDKMTKADVNVKEICPAAQGAKNHQPVSYDPGTKLFYVAPTTSAWTTRRSA